MNRAKLFLSFSKNNSQGQTLVETLVAVFILTMGITSALGLATFSLATSKNVTKQIVAAGLAREGIELTKNMRDTNWLKQTVIDKDCHNFVSGNTSPAAGSCPNGSAGGACCYKNWRTGPLEPFDLDPPGTNKSYRLYYNTSDGTFMDLAQNEPNKSGLNFDPVVGSLGIYWSDVSGYIHGTSDFYRNIVITEENDPPYDKSDNVGPGPRLKIQSQVWWTDKKCPRAEYYVDANAGCKIEFISYLTNWKNY